MAGSLSSFLDLAVDMQLFNDVSKSQALSIGFGRLQE